MGNYTVVSFVHKALGVCLNAFEASWGKGSWPTAKSNNLNPTPGGEFPSLPSFSFSLSLIPASSSQVCALRKTHGNTDQSSNSFCPAWGYLVSASDNSLSFQHYLPESSSPMVLIRQNSLETAFCSLFFHYIMQCLTGGNGMKMSSL